MIEMAVNTNIPKFSTLEADLMIMGMVTSKGCIIVAVSPPDFSMSDSNLFFLGQRRQ